MHTHKKTPLKLFNTASRKKEELIPIEDNHVKLYTCGPTVYNYAHIGNFRTYVFEDLLHRTIKFLGMKLTHVMNLTDVDDKTIVGATTNNMSLEEFTKPFIQAFFDDLATLHIEKADFYPAATQYIPEMIEIIQSLLEKGIAYEGGDGSIYYAIRKFPRYGCLSHFHIDELQVGASERVEADEYDKENVADFVLWKKCDPERDGNIFWESPFGIGRPGWHMECSAMAMKLLGESIDIHCGGVDNMFPHHENEIAQCEAYSGKHFTNIWLHSEHLLVDGKKMSKSLGNFYKLKELIDKGFSAEQIRYLLLTTHYRTQLNFTFAGLEAAKHSIERLSAFIQRLLNINDDTHKEEESIYKILDTAFDDFTTALADDLNISAALAALFDMIREINTLCDENKVNRPIAQKVIELMKHLDTILGVMSFTRVEDEIPEALKEALTNRNLARKNKDWATSDELRDFIHSQGYSIEDTSTGARLKRSI